MLNTWPLIMAGKRLTYAYICFIGREVAAARVSRVRPLFLLAAGATGFRVDAGRHVIPGGGRFEHSDP